MKNKKTAVKLKCKWCGRIYISGKDKNLICPKCGYDFDLGPMLEARLKRAREEYPKTEVSEDPDGTVRTKPRKP